MAINLEKDRSAEAEPTAVGGNRSINPVTGHDNMGGGDEKVGGWLKFFLVFFVGAGSVLSLLVSLVSLVSYYDALASWVDLGNNIIYF